MKTAAIIVMGVSGSGKTTLGQALAAELGWAFADADDFHSQSNKEKMARSEALTDTDRQPWLERLHGLLAEHVRGGHPLVLACSALKEKYRRTLIGDLNGVQIVFTHGSKDLLAQHMQNRQHFMPLSLLDSQLATLEPPQNAIDADISLPLADLVQAVVRQLD